MFVGCVVFCVGFCVVVGLCVYCVCCFVLCVCLFGCCVCLWVLCVLFCELVDCVLFVLCWCCIVFECCVVCLCLLLCFFVMVFFCFEETVEWVLRGFCVSCGLVCGFALFLLLVLCCFVWFWLLFMLGIVLFGYMNAGGCGFWCSVEFGLGVLML